MKFDPKGLINSKPTLAQIMVLRQADYKPLSEAMMVYFNGAYICHSASID